MLTRQTSNPQLSKRSISSASLKPSVCSIVNFIQDLDKATRPLTKIASEEYFRALKSHPTQRSDCISIHELPAEVCYGIDKTVRQRLKEGLFGYDHSQLIALELEIRDSFKKNTTKFKTEEDRKAEEEIISQVLVQRLAEVVDKNRPKKMSYEEWKRKKATEERLKKRLLVDALQYEYEKKIIEEEQVRQKQESSSKKIREWDIRKKLETGRKAQEEAATQAKMKEEENRRKEAAEMKFKEWLKDNVSKLKSDKRKEREEKKQQERLKKKYERELELKKRRSEIEFQLWVEKKNKEEEEREEIQQMESIDRIYEPKRKKHIILAYSPNKHRNKLLYTQTVRESINRKIKSITSTQTEEEKESPMSPISPMSPMSPSDIKPKLRQPPKLKHKKEGKRDQTFAELSSIRKSPVVHERYESGQVEESGESFMSNLEEDMMSSEEDF